MSDTPTLERLIASIPLKPDTAAIAREFVPPPRFKEKLFSTYDPRHPSQRQAAETLEQTAATLGRSHSRLSRLLFRGPATHGARGIYLDGGFGVGKTHLLAALWNAAPQPAAYLSFDELMYFVGVSGVERAAAVFHAHHLVAIDEWELDDPGNLKIALAFLRAVLTGRPRVAVTSNTLPLELGAGRFSQKDFRSEIEELAGSFAVLRLEGEDYRQRRFEWRPSRGYFLQPADLPGLGSARSATSIAVEFERLIETLRQLHPIHYRQLARRAGALLISGMRPVDTLPDALRWVHFVDSLYDARVRLYASGEIPLFELFQPEALAGPFGKKLARCLSRLEEMLGEGCPAAEASEGVPGETTALGL